ncbi:thioesterase family protein [Streptomyces sp. ISL-11]|uniref:acyl-CoA thioesterase n=1 Tax=Streptomyces sp. ISL-11 TaxID=2819174 RepID=UPI001BE7CB12|nr:thioesterase family protein [Streptomyces sp. ISL-11]MBT2386620.1 hypothetical protein [Streptomyces sp. ISL-11]
MGAFKHCCTLRWSDVNAYGLVGDAALAAYVEEARAALCVQVADLRTGDPLTPLVYLTVRQHIDYLKPLRWCPEPVEVRLHVLRTRPAAVELLAEVSDNARIYARAWVLSVCWDTGRARPHLLSHAQLRMLEGFMLQGLQPESRRLPGHRDPARRPESPS